MSGPILSARDAYMAGVYDTACAFEHTRLAFEAGAITEDDRFQYLRDEIEFLSQKRFNRHEFDGSKIEVLA